MLKMYFCSGKASKVFVVSEEIYISCHKLNQNDNFVSKYPSSVAAILKLRFRDHVTPIFQPTPISDPGP